MSAPAAAPPLRVAVLADFAPGRALPRCALDRQHFDEVLAAVSPTLELTVPDALADGEERVLPLRFAAWRDFSPAGLAEQVPALARARSLLERLAAGDADAAQIARDAEGVAPAAWRASLGAAGASAAPAPDPPRPAPDPPPDGGVDAILDLVSEGAGDEAATSAKRIVEGLVTRPARGSASHPFADAAEELARRIAAQLDAILAAPPLRALARAWTGLRWLVLRTDFREEVAMELVGAPIDGAADAVRALGDGRDVDVVIAAYEHDASARDLERVRALGSAGESIQAAVVTGLAPAFFGVDTWHALRRGESPRARFAGEAFSAWRSLRRSEAARWLVLVANRLALRARYGAEGEPTRGLSYEEPAPGGLLGTGAWGVAANLVKSWARTRTPVQLSGTRHGLIPDLPLLDGPDGPSPVEGGFGDEGREDFEAIGLVAVQRYRRDVAFLGAVRTFRLPERHPDPEATADAAQQVTLAYQILAARLVKRLGSAAGELAGLTREEAADALRDLAVAHFSRPDAALGADHVGVEVRDDDDPGRSAVTLRVQPEVQLAGRPVHILLRFTLSR